MECAKVLQTNLTKFIKTSGEKQNSCGLIIFRAISIGCNQIRKRQIKPKEFRHNLSVWHLDASQENWSISSSLLSNFCTYDLAKC